MHLIACSESEPEVPFIALILLDNLLVKQLIEHAAIQVKQVS